MCNVCISHGYGKTWYKNAENYARQMYKLHRPGEVSAEASGDPEGQAQLILSEAVEAKALHPERFEELRRTAIKLATQYAVAQAIPLVDV